MPAPDRILVLGGTGFVGHALLARLSREIGIAARLTVPSRRPQRAKDLSVMPGVRVVEADVHDPSALERLVAQHEAVVNLVAVLQGDAARFEAVHVELPRRLAAACQRTGVTRVVHVSALGVAADAPSLYLRSKHAGEAVLRAAPLALSVLRPSIVFGADDRFMNQFAAMAALAPLMAVPGARARMQPVWVDDVAAALAACLRRDDSIGQTYEAVGPREYTLGELVRLAGAWSGHARPVLALPDALGQVMAALMRLMPGEPPLSADNLASLRVPSVASGSLPGLAALGITPTALEQVMPVLLAAGPTRLDAYRTLARRG
jgi:NADH dehydrogenase